MTLNPYLSTAEDQRTIWHMGALMQFKATGDDNGGQYWLAEQTCHAGYASPLHRHAREDELFIVLDGEISVTVDETTHKVPTGGVAFAPRGLAHTFAVTSPTARFLILTTPAGFENWFFQTGEEARTATVPPPPEGMPDVPALLASLAPYEVEFLAPPPQDVAPGGAPG